MTGIAVRTTLLGFPTTGEAPMRFALLAALAIGCSSDAPEEPEADAPPNPAVAPSPEVAPERMKVPDDINSLASMDLTELFYRTSFRWGNGPGHWEYLDRQQRSAALFGSGIVRNEYQDSFSGNPVRIKEHYYEPGKLKTRWQEEQRGGRWVSHGPEVFWEDDGTFEVLFRIDGEVEGPRIYFDAEGKELRRDHYREGVQQVEWASQRRPPPPKPHPHRGCGFLRAPTAGKADCYGIRNR